MGVSGFFRWISKRYPLIRKSMKVLSRPRFNNLFIDANSIFYRAVSSVNETVSDLTPSLLAEILRYIDLLVQVSNPSDLIFIALDGPGPLSKLRIQRQHRFAKAASSKNGFDSVAFSPGTEFMHKLNKEIVKFIQEQIRNNAWGKVKVILSGSSTPGEGEHKIINYIRMLKGNNEWNSDTTSCLYSTDADLIFLCLSLHEPNICIMREADAVHTHTVCVPYYKAAPYNISHT